MPNCIRCIGDWLLQGRGLGGMAWLEMICGLVNCEGLQKRQDLTLTLAGGEGYSGDREMGDKCRRQQAQLAKKVSISPHIHRYAALPRVSVTALSGGGVPDNVMVCYTQRSWKLGI